MQQNGFIELTNKAEEHQKKYQYKSAIETYQFGLKVMPEHTLFLAYNTGVLYQTVLGFGDYAKEYYLKAVEWHKEHSDYLLNNPDARWELDKILSNVYENLSLLSESYEEMYDWAEKVWQINPKEEILRENIESTKRAQDKGVKWPDVYFELASLFWNTNPSKDRGLHGFGASIYRQLLVNRKKYRLSRQLYGYCANGYGGLMLLIISNIGKRAEKIPGNLIFNEVDFILDDSISLLTEYLDTNRVQGCVGQLDEIRSKTKLGLWKSEETKIAGATDRDSKKIQTFTTIGSIAGLVAVWLLREKYELIQGWGYYFLGFFGGSFLGGIFSYIINPGQNSDKINSNTSLGRNGKSQFDINLTDVEWQLGNDLLSTANTLGFSKVICKMDSVSINHFDNALELIFVPEGPYPRELMHQIGLALRCSVARTLGIAAAATKDLFVMEPTQEYNIKLGDGMIAEAFSLKYGEMAVGPLQTTSKEIGEQWVVQIKPFIIEIASSQETYFKLREVLSRLIPTFETIKDLRIRF